MNGQLASLIYLGMAGVYMLIVTTRRTREMSAGWKVGAALVWVGVFVALAVLADSLGLQLP